jgi:hypothetical protein
MELNMKFKKQLIQRMKDNADAARQQRDAEWDEYTTRPDMLFAVIEDPEIRTPPSEWDRDRILKQITKEQK